MTTPLIDALRTRLGSAALTPDHVDFRAEITGFNAASTFSPDVVVMATEEADVAAAVAIAAAFGALVTVQATGHGAHAPVRGGVLITTSRMRVISVDPRAGTATVAAGVRWADLAPELEPFGLTAVSGAAPSVGAVGLVLGGGIGPLSRTLGCASDYAEAFRVVDGAGTVHEVDAEHDPELFWALRGGKVGLGIVTQMRIRLVALPLVYAGGLFFDGPDIEDALRLWADWTASVPDSVNSSVAIIRFPDLDAVPPMLRGRTVLHLRFAYVDAAANAEELVVRGAEYLDCFRDLGTAILDTVGPLPTHLLGSIHADPADPILSWESGLFLNEFDQSAVTDLLAIVGHEAPVPLMAVEVRHFGGRIAVGDSARGGCDARFGLFLIGAPVPELFAEVLPGIAAAVHAAMGERAHDYINYHWAGHRPRASFDGVWTPEQNRRLDAARAAIDPDGRFAFGQAVEAAAGASIPRR